MPSMTQHRMTLIAGVSAITLIAAAIGVSSLRREPHTEALPTPPAPRDLHNTSIDQQVDAHINMDRAALLTAEVSPEPSAHQSANSSAAALIHLDGIAQSFASGIGDDFLDSPEDYLTNAMLNPNGMALSPALSAAITQMLNEARELRRSYSLEASTLIHTTATNRVRDNLSGGPWAAGKDRGKKRASVSLSVDGTQYEIDVYDGDLPALDDIYKTRLDSSRYTNEAIARAILEALH